MTPTVVSPIDLEIIKTSVGEFIVGKEGVYQLLIRNVGILPTIGPIIVTDTLPTGLTFISAIGAGWVCGAVLQDVTCTYAGVLNPGGSLSIELTVGIAIDAAGLIINTGVVTTEEDENPDNDTDDTPVIILHGPLPAPVASPLGVVAMILLLCGVAALGLVRRRDHPVG